MHGTGWTEVTALVAAFVIAVAATPAGISGAVLLLPFQVSVLGTPSPAVTPTNLLYNILATPGALYRYWRQGQTGHPGDRYRRPVPVVRPELMTAPPPSSSQAPDPW